MKAAFALRVLVAAAALLLAAALSAQPASGPRHQPLPAETAQLSQALLQHYLDAVSADAGVLLSRSQQLRLGPFLSAVLRREQPGLAAQARTAALRVQLDEQLAVQVEVLAFGAQAAQQAVLAGLRARLLGAGAPQVRAARADELEAVWPNLGWDLQGGVWVAQSGSQRLLFDLPSAAVNDQFLYVETLDPQDSCFRMGALADAAGAPCLCAYSPLQQGSAPIEYSTRCPVTPAAGAPVRRAAPQEHT